MTSRKLISAFLFIISFFLIPENAFSQKRICKIKYGERLNETNLEKKFFQSSLPETIKRKYEFDCYKIGVEHDDKKKPLQGKPIYACCQNYIPFTFNQELII